ncbi:ribosomal protein L21-like protein, partial [Dimargaris cristalligena]
FGPDTKALVNRLRNQINYFATVRIKGRLFTVTEGDMIVTERMADLALGDVLQLDRVKEIGSRDFSIVGKPYVSPEYYTIRAVVMEHTLSSPITVVKFKKRKDYKKTIVYQHKYTLLRVSKLDV